MIKETIKVKMRNMVHRWFKWQMKILKLYNGKSALLGGLDAICLAYEKVTDEYCSFEIRPKYAGNLQSLNIHNPNNPKYAIILQGPIEKEEHFTLETIKFYKKIFPEAVLIVSTWDTEEPEEIHSLKEAGAHIILSKLPAVSGLRNVNYQFASTYAGICKASEYQCQYIMKTRTDQRIYKDNAFERLYSLLKEFPCEKPDMQKERIIFCNSRSKTMFWPCFYEDFFSFGNIEDMRLFYGEEMDLRFETRNDVDTILPDITTRHMLSKEGLVAECYIISRYLKKLGFNLNYSVKEHWEIIRQLFCTVSETDIDLYWLDKYGDRFRSHHKNGGGYMEDYFVFSDRYNLDFLNWLSIYQQTVVYNENLEEFQNKPCTKGSVIL